MKTMTEISFTTEELFRYSQQIKLPEIGLEGQAELKKARVLCVGLGGLGSPLSLYLAAAGIGTLGLVDDDLVEESNLHRQLLYNSTNLCQPKVQAAKTNLQALNPYLQLDTWQTRINQDNAAELISHYDIVADCSDNFQSRYLIHDTCYKLDKPYVYASTRQFLGHCSLFHGKEGPCLRCLFPVLPDPDIYADCHNGGVLGVMPGILGLLQATEIIKWILKIGKSLQQRLLIMDLSSMNFQEIQLVKNLDCPFSHA